jgi:hypothetical protein
MDGKVCTSIYVHWDGYLEHNGKLLAEHYTDPAKVQELIALGDLSSLGREIGQKHPFDNFNLVGDDLALSQRAQTEDWTTAYNRDRGETGTEAIKAYTFAEFLHQVNNCGAEYYYIFENGSWYAGSVYSSSGLVKGGLTALTEALSFINEETSNA